VRGETDKQGVQTPAFMLETTRLKLIPATVELARSEIADRHEFARLLAAKVPDNWPPETLADALPLFLTWLEESPDRIGWFSWYVLASGEGEVPGSPVLVGSVGFKGPPHDGITEVGYSVLSQFQGRGYATEMVWTLVKWALAQPGVERVVAETEWDNPASVRVLDKIGFSRIGPTANPGGERFEFRGSVKPADSGRLQV
jgi:[ribosomal protein S5]-alanine N-acetyltransferase